MRKIFTKTELQYFAAQVFKMLDGTKENEETKQEEDADE